MPRTACGLSVQVWNSAVAGSTPGPAPAGVSAANGSSAVNECVPGRRRHPTPIGGVGDADEIYRWSPDALFPLAPVEERHAEHLVRGRPGTAHRMMGDVFDRLKASAQPPGDRPGVGGLQRHGVNRELLRERQVVLGDADARVATDVPVVEHTGAQRCQTIQLCERRKRVSAWTTSRTSVGLDVDLPDRVAETLFAGGRPHALRKLVAPPREAALLPHAPLRIDLHLFVQMLDDGEAGVAGWIGVPWKDRPWPW